MFVGRTRSETRLSSGALSGPSDPGTKRYSLGSDPSSPLEDSQYVDDSPRRPRVERRVVP